MNKKEKLIQILYSFLIIFFSITLTYFLFTKTQTTLILIGLTLFSLISFKKPLISLYLILLLPVLGEFSRFTFLNQSIILSDLLLPVFIITLLPQVLKSKFDKRLKLILKLISIFILIAIFSLIFSLTELSITEVLKSSLYLIRFILYFSLLPFSYFIISKYSQSKKVIFWIVISALLLVITGIIQLIYLPDLKELALQQGYDPHINRLVGSWLDPNFIGGFFAFISTLILSLAIYEKNKKVKIFYSISIFIFISALFFTYSRSAYLALFASIFMLGLLKARKLLLIFLLIFFIGINFSSRAKERVGELITSITSVITQSSENPDPTARLRIKNWNDTIELIKQKPLLGHGYNTLTFTKVNQGFIENTEIHSASGSDSSLLTILVTTGIFGLLVYLSIIILILKYSLLNWLKYKNNPYLQGLNLGVFCSFIGLLVHSFFVNSLLFPQILIYFWIIIGIFYYKNANKQLV